jgi:hypothetical protein
MGVGDNLDRRLGTLEEDVLLRRDDEVTDIAERLRPSRIADPDQSDAGVLLVEAEPRELSGVQTVGVERHPLEERTPSHAVGARGRGDARPRQVDDLNVGDAGAGWAGVVHRYRWCSHHPTPLSNEMITVVSICRKSTG